MKYNAFILDWTMDNYQQLKAKLVKYGFAYVPEEECRHIRVAVAWNYVAEFAVLCQEHLNQPYNYVDIQFPTERTTVVVFQTKTFFVRNTRENERVRQWALAQGLPTDQADWSVAVLDPVLCESGKVT